VPGSGGLDDLIGGVLPGRDNGGGRLGGVGRMIALAAGAFSIWQTMKAQNDDPDNPRASEGGLMSILGMDDSGEDERRDSTTLPAQSVSSQPGMSRSQQMRERARKMRGS
jgi:hypothetical protein